MMSAAQIPVMKECRGSGVSDEGVEISEAQIAFVLKQAEDGTRVDCEREQPRIAPLKLKVSRPMTSEAIRRRISAT